MNMKIWDKTMMKPLNFMVDELPAQPPKPKVENDGSIKKNKQILLRSSLEDSM